MTHLSDTSYLQRAIGSIWFYIWFIVYVFRWDRFEALRLQRLLRFELRSVVTFLVLTAMPLMLAYDVVSTRIKYTEGFWINPLTQEIQERPAEAWSEPDQVHIEPLYYTLACALALENCAFFLLQSFWSYISKSVTKTSFMSSFEFKVNIVCSLFAMALYPTIQYLFRNDFAYREAAPQLVFSIMTFITGVLGIRTHFRLAVLIRTASEIRTETTVNVVQKLQYFKDMNLILALGFFGCSIPLGIMSADGLLPNPIIATNKFASDFLIANLNFFEFIVWVTLILIFYPRKQAGAGSPFMGSASGISNKDCLPRFNMVNPKEHFSNNDDGYIEYPKELASGGPRSPLYQRNFSMDSRQQTLAPLSPTTALPPAAAKVAKGSLNPPPRTNSLSKKPSKPRLMSSTLYYHDALAKAQQAENEQSNEQYAKGLENGTINDPKSLPQPQSRHSDNSQYSIQSQQPLISKPTKNPSRNTPGPMDHYSPSRTDNIPRSFSSDCQMQYQHHNDMGPYERTSEDSDREMIQVAYIRDLSQVQGQDAAQVSKFYEDVQEVTKASAHMAPGPYSPRHF
ncbi:hypothetical protein BGZ46_008782 [Entomortierella lignicola]|nr:hypothetical protein BGZ46_008782 [Entomortierella lignicola]